MNWRELITSSYEARPHRAGIRSRPWFHPGASAAEIADAEARLDTRLAESLHSLLLDTNGVMEMLSVDDGEWFESLWLVWPFEELVGQNVHYRAQAAAGRYQRDFQTLLIFAGAGCDGILFGFPVLPDRTCASSVVTWYPIGDRRVETGCSLAAFIRGWTTGTLGV